MVEKNRYGFYSVIHKPSEEELAEYYSKKYYQEGVGAYEIEYSPEEILYFNNKINERFFIIDSSMPDRSAQKSLLDVGCGEGWVLNFFKEKGWNVKGLDYSSYGCAKFNSACLDDLVVGNIYDSIDRLCESEIEFDVIWLDNVLEHVIDPETLIQKLKRISVPNGLLVVEVPNDFSVIQKFLLERGLIDDEFWVVLPDHLSYFNSAGLVKLLEEFRWNVLELISDYPIDWNLLNADTNYIQDKSKGKSCHRERVAFENLIHTQPMEKVIALYRAMAHVGLGRQIVGVFRNA